MKNVYSVTLAKPIPMETYAPHYSGKATQYLHVIASSFAAAHEAVLKKYPGVEIRGISLLTYAGLPLVIGD